MTPSPFACPHAVERAIALASARTPWWDRLTPRRWLLAASKLVCVGGIFLPACGRAGSHAWVVLSAFAWVGLLGLGVIAVMNRGLPTPQGGLAFVASCFEVRGAWRLMLSGPPLAAAAAEAAPAGAASGTESKDKKRA